MLHTLYKKLYRLITFQPLSDIALARDESSRFLPWIIALMVYLSALVLAGGFTLNNTINNSYNAQTESFSVNIPHIPLPDKEHEIIEKVISALKSAPGVASVELVSTDQIKTMVAPWLGKSEALANLPLPSIIEAKAIKGSTLDYDAMRKKVDAMVGGASIDDHKKWIADFAGFINVIQYTLLLIAVIILSATAFVVIFACKTSLKIHRNTVNLLHRLGAMDNYIAKQFQEHAARLTLKGAFVGCGFASMTLMALHITASRIDSPLFPAFSFSLNHWLILFLLPVFTSMLAGFAARFSVLKTLRCVP